MKTLLLMLLAASLEVGGDALIRAGLKAHGGFLLLLGPAVLVTYGFLVNLTALEFGRLMGFYIVLFFVIAQATAIVFFREKLPLPMVIGGLLVVAGGLTMACWHTP